MKRNGERSAVAALTKLLHDHRPPIEMIHRNLPVARVDRRSHLVGELWREIAATKKRPTAEINGGDRLFKTGKFFARHGRTGKTQPFQSLQDVRTNRQK